MCVHIHTYAYMNTKYINIYVFTEKFRSHSKVQQNHSKILIFRKFIFYQVVTRFGVYYYVSLM